jgi:hypothetical protein
VPTTPQTSSWLFPPRTRDVQRDEQWPFVAKKEMDCDPTDPADDYKGDWWDHVAIGPEHRLGLAVVPGGRSIKNAEHIVCEVRACTAAGPPRLVSSDEYPAYATAIQRDFGAPANEPVAAPGRRPIAPACYLPEGLTCATVHKERENNLLVRAERRLILGTERRLREASAASAVSRTVNTPFVERSDGTGQGRSAPKAGRTYRFSKVWRVHEAISYFTRYGDNFCWAVRTLRQRDRDGRWQRRTPAMAAGFAERVW